MSAILKRNMHNGAFTKRNPSCDNALLNRRRHGCLSRNRHLDVRASREENRPHSLLVRLILEENPFPDPAFAVIMPGSAAWIIPWFLQRVVEVAVDKELDAGFEGKLVGADCSVHLCLLP